MHRSFPQDVFETFAIEIHDHSKSEPEPPSLRPSSNSDLENSHSRTRFRELAFENSLSRTHFRELTFENLLSRTHFRELAFGKSLSRTHFRELAFENSLSRTRFRELAFENSLLRSCQLLGLQTPPHSPVSKWTSLFRRPHSWAYNPNSSNINANGVWCSLVQEKIIFQYHQPPSQSASIEAAAAVLKLYTPVFIQIRVWKVPILPDWFSKLLEASSSFHSCLSHSCVNHFNSFTHRKLLFRDKE
jgi:ribosomal protein S14